jgi:hypothetical protein
MRPARWALLSSVIAWIVLYVAGFAALGSSVPTVDSTAQEVLDWFTNNGARADTWAWTWAVSSLALAVFGAIIASLMPRPHRYLMLAGVFGWVIVGQVQAWFWAGLALNPEGLDPATARTIFDISAFIGPVVNGSTITMAAAVFPLGFGRAPTIPRWLAWISVAFFVEQGVETITIFGGDTGFIAPNGAMNVYLGGLFGMAWVIGMLVWGMQRLGSPDTDLNAAVVTAAGPGPTATR